MAAGDPFPSDAWLAAVHHAAADLPEFPGVSVTVAVEITSGKAPKRRFGAVITDGRLTSLTPGRPADADCTVSCVPDDARQMLTGQLDPAVAYMQGRLKIEGAYERVLFGLRPLLTTPAFKTFATTVSTLTAADGPLGAPAGGPTPAPQGAAAQPRSAPSAAESG